MAGVHLGHIRWHRIEALQECVIIMEDNEAILIVRIIITDLGIDVVETRLVNRQDAIVNAEVLLPLIVAAGRGMPHIHITMISCR